MGISQLLFPNRCPFCSRVIEANKPCCVECRKYVDVVPHRQQLSNGCFCISAFRHEDLYRKAILKYKYNRYRQLYIPFSIILSNIISNCCNNISFDYYTSVPPHKNKPSGRPFDQVKLLAKETAKLNNSAYKPLLCQTKEIRSQHTLSMQERLSNVDSVYKYINQINISNKNILLFDDVITTGATLTECSGILIEGGAKIVYCITVTW